LIIAQIPGLNLTSRAQAQTSLIPAPNDSYRIKYLGVDAIIGDDKEAGFQPRFTLLRWDGEGSLTLGFDDSAILIKDVSTLGDEISWSTPFFDFLYYPVEPRIEYLTVGKNTYEFLQNELGGFEFEVVLKQRPPIDVWTFQIETKGLDFYYQPPLENYTWEDGDGDGEADTFRPENVVGSYAVYHESKRNNNFKTGKAFHIYRPLLIDADGAEAWGELNIDEKQGTLTISLPSDFLNSAKYPVIVDPSFGYDTVGGTTSWARDSILATNFTSPESGTATSITAYTWAFSATYYGDAKTALYLSSDLSYIQTTETIYVDWTSGAWTTFQLDDPDPSVSNTNYRLAWWTAEDYIYHKYDNGAPSGKMIRDTSRVMNGWPDPIIADISYTRIMSIYCNYTTGAGGTNYNRTVSQSLTWAGVVSRTWNLTRVFTQGISASFEASRGPFNFSRILNQAVTYASSASRILSLVRVVSQPLEFSSSVFRSLISGAESFTRAVSVALSWSSDVSRELGILYSRVVSQGLEFASSVSRRLGLYYTRTVSQAYTWASSAWANYIESLPWKLLTIYVVDEEILPVPSAYALGWLEASGNLSLSAPTNSSGYTPQFNLTMGNYTIQVSKNLYFPQIIEDSLTHNKILQIQITSLEGSAVTNVDMGLAVLFMIGMIPSIVLWILFYLKEFNVIAVLSGSIATPTWFIMGGYWIGEYSTYAGIGWLFYGLGIVHLILLIVVGLFQFRPGETGFDEL